MKLKIFLVLYFFIFFLLPAKAGDVEQIEYKNLKNNSKITCENGVWTTKVGRKNKQYYLKKTQEGVSKFTEFYSPEGEFLFSTGTQYEFIHNGSLIGYSNYDLKFYEFYFVDNLLEQRELLTEEVQELFPDYQIINVLNFSETNSYKIKKKQGDLKIILNNNTDRVFNNYWFSTNNSKIKVYDLRGFLDISKKGMIQFSRFNDNSKANPWYVILVR